MIRHTCHVLYSYTTSLVVNNIQQHQNNKPTHRKYADKQVHVKYHVNVKHKQWSLVGINSGYW